MFFGKSLGKNSCDRLQSAEAVEQTPAYLSRLPEIEEVSIHVGGRISSFSLIVFPVTLCTI